MMWPVIVVILAVAGSVARTLLLLLWDRRPRLQEDAPLPKDAYDFVIVGGGSAGAVVAARLASEGHIVLLIEAGEEDRGVFFKIPMAALGFQATKRESVLSRIANHCLPPTRTLMLPLCFIASRSLGIRNGGRRRAPHERQALGRGRWLPRPAADPVPWQGYWWVLVAQPV